MGNTPHAAKKNICDRWVLLSDLPGSLKANHTNQNNQGKSAMIVIGR